MAQGFCKALGKGLNVSGLGIYRLPLYCAAYFRGADGHVNIVLQKGMQIL